MRYNHDAKKCRTGGNLLASAGVWSLLLYRGQGLGMDRFEILKEPTGTYSIFDTSTELPVTIEDKTFIGLCRHEVPLALLAAIEAVQPGSGLVLPSLSPLNGQRGDEDHRPLSEDLHA